jgi:hypothetical protein
LALGFAAGVALAAPARAGDILLNCYLLQSGAGRALRFVRRLDIDSRSRSVAIADDLDRTGFRGRDAYGRLVSADADRIVFDYTSFDSSGRTTIDRRSGTYFFSDGRIVLRGNCVATDF